MKPKSKAIAVAAAGTALGVVGLGVIAMPAGAGDDPQLPPITAEELVKSVADAQRPAFEGTVEVTNQLGLPSVPGMGQFDIDSAKVYSDGENGARVGVRDGSTEHTVVHKGSTVWTYDSAKNAVTKVTLPEGAGHERERAAKGDPTAMVDELLGTIRESSTVSVDGTATVANRPAYELVLTPKPTERTLLRDVRVAVDSQTRLPLRASVHTNGTTEPALEVGFSDISFGDQPDELFTFTPPQGAKVTEETVTRDGAEKGKDKAKEFQVVGDGWDTTLVGRIPQDALAGKARPDEARGEDNDWGRADTSLRGILGQVGKPVSGAFGSGHVITTKVGTALVTDDGRFAAGFVPEQVLTQALERK